VRKNKLLVLGVIGVLLLLPLYSIKAEQGFLHASYEYHYTQEKEKRTTGIYVNILLNKSEIPFVYDYIVLDIFGYFQVKEVKNVGEHLDFFILYVMSENTSTFECISIAYFNFFQIDNYQIFIKNILLDSIFFGNYKNISKSYISNLNIGDIVILEEVEGTVSHSYFLHLFVDFYKRDFEVRQDFLEEITDFDSPFDLFFAPLSLPLVLVSAEDPFIQMLGIVFAIGEILILIIVLRKIYEWIVW